MLHFIFSFNLGELSLYRLLFKISTFLVLQTSIFNSDLINVQRLLIMIRFNQLHWEYIWLAHPQSFLKTCFGLSVVFSKFSEYLVMIKDSPCFSFKTRNFKVFFIFEDYYILIIVRIIVEMFSWLFVLARKCLVPNAPLHCRHPYQNRNHLMNSCLHLSFESQIPYYNYVKSQILWCFQNQQFAQ